MKTAAKKESGDHRQWYTLALALVIVVTVATRFYKVTEPDHVW